jgi:hypothetical protein
MAWILGHFDVGDYDAWKPMFDSDPAGRKQGGKGHRVLRSVENPSEVFVSVEFPSVDEAKAFKERLLASSALDRVDVKLQPTIAELVDQTDY